MGYSRKKTWDVTSSGKRRSQTARDLWEGTWWFKTGKSRTRSRFGRKASKASTFFGPRQVAVSSKAGFRVKTVNRFTQRWF